MSTCYVAGNRRGNAPEELVSEGPFDLGLSWRDEVTSARRLRSDSEAASRQPDRLAHFRADARRELGAAGAPALAAKTEQLRERWVRDQLVEAGRARAASVGWPDAYAFTKALGEQALIDSRGAVPVSIVRPSIIESAWTEPRPGWIRGFRMAEPVILSYGRGLLREFPGVPEGTVDVIPVDLVVAAIITVAALGPDDAPPICQVASGGINPLKYRTLVDNVSGWFIEHPIYDAVGQPIVVPEWRFPGRGRVQGQLTPGQDGDQPGRATAPRVAAAGQAGRAVGQAGEQAPGGRAGAGVRRAVRPVHRVRGDLPGRQPAGDVGRPRRRRPARPSTSTRAASTGSTTSARSTCRRSSSHARVKTGPGRTTTDRTGRLRRQVLSPDRHLAAFDLENTLIASNVVESYTFLATRRLDNAERLRYVLRTAAEAPRLLKLDRADRTDFLRHFYRRYENAPVEQIAVEASELLSDVILTKSFPAGIRRVREHRALGHRTILITGALDFAVDCLRPLFDEIIAAEMTVKPDGTYSGEMTAVPPTGEARAQVMADYAAAEGLDLAQAVAYADSSSDLPMLEAVGFPVAVNPETRLAAIARKRGWLVEHWSKASGAGGRPFPMAPVMAERERRRSFR